MATRVNLTRQITFRDTKANVEANSGTLEEVTLAYATDTGEIGVYTNGAWAWIGAGNGQYRELMWEDDGAGGWEWMTDESDNGPMWELRNLE